MPFIGNKPSAVPLTSADIADSIITSAKIVDATITNSDVASSIITGQTAETSIAGGDSVLIYDDSASALRKMTRTNFVSGLGGLTEADQWRLTTDFTTDAEITSNLERVDTYGFDLLGTGMSQSSGVFTFPSTGYWLIMAQATILSNQYGNALLGIMVTTNNSTYNYSNQIRQGNAHYGYATEPNATGAGFSIIDVTSTANVKVKFRSAAFGSGSILRGDTDTNVTSFIFIKLGET